MPPALQRQLSTDTLRCIVITNESHPEIKFDVLERLNTNTVPLNAQEIRNCVYRGPLISMLQEAVAYEPWLSILNRRTPDKRMRDEELALRFFAYQVLGVASYRTPLKHWLNDAAKAGSKYTEAKINSLKNSWEGAVSTALVWFQPGECFRRPPLGHSRAVNRALFDLVMLTASQVGPDRAKAVRTTFRRQYATLLKTKEFIDLISRAVDHRKRTRRRFKLWKDVVAKTLLP